MITDFWARHYDERRLAGKEDEEEFEDEDFDLEKVKRLMESNPDDWETLLED